MRMNWEMDKRQEHEEKAMGSAASTEFEMVQ